MAGMVRRWLAHQVIKGMKPEDWFREFAFADSSGTGGVHVSVSSAQRMSAVSRSIGLIAETAAVMPMLLYRRRPKNEGRDQLLDHPSALMVALEPNDWQTPIEFWRHLYQHAATRGNGYAYTPRDNSGRTIEGIPLHADFVRVLVARTRIPVYEFMLPYSNETIRCGPDEMIHLRWRSQDGYVGQSPIRDHARTIGAAIAAEEYAAKLFRDDATPSGVLSIPGKVGPERVKEIASQWREQHQSNRQTTVLSNGAEYKPISITPDEGQFLETRGFQVEDIGRIWGVPPFLLGATAKSTSWGTGLEQQLKAFLKLTMLPWLAIGQQAAWRGLLLPSEKKSFFFEHDTDVLNAADILARAQAQQVQLLNGVINPNEARADEGRNPYPGGDAYRVPSNTIPQNAPDAARQIAGMLLALADQADGRATQEGSHAEAED
jgi:HK97 family phage portal protein